MRPVDVLAIRRQDGDSLTREVSLEPESFHEETEVPEYTLYRPGDVAMATFVGTPIAGAIVSGLNSVSYTHLRAHETS